MSTQEAVRSKHKEVVTVLLRHGAKILGSDGTTLIDLSESPLAGAMGDEEVAITSLAAIDYDWEIDPAALRMGKKIGKAMGPKPGVIATSLTCSPTE